MERDVSHGLTPLTNQSYLNNKLVEVNGLEPMTPSVQSWCSPN
jgi:hypothetical protein